MTAGHRHNIEDGMTSNKRSSEGNMNNTPSGDKRTSRHNNNNKDNNNKEEPSVSQMDGA